jgi:hypothetical protein
VNRAVAHPGNVSALIGAERSPGWLDYCVPIVQMVLAVVMPSVPALSDR